MTSNEIRRSFLEFFERHGHRIVPSSPLVPAGDPTLLFTNAGMNQFKDVFLGKDRREYRRATSSQKCMRVSGKHNDLENVGPSLRHHTFFEMLGNFSFGDYFKNEAIALAWELLTGVWKIPPGRLYATVFGGEEGIPHDDEAYHVWRRFLPPDRIGELGLADNFWAMGDTGPCGRCSEIHYFRGDEIPCPEPVCKGLACGCDRFVEIWNNVFMEFDRDASGALKPLPAPSIDTGMGLERVTAVLQATLSNYDTDLFKPLLERISDLTNVPYGPHVPGVVSASGDVHIRVISDHIRAMTFLIADGVFPSNEWRGYVLRKIMRRAMRHGKLLMMSQPFLYQLVDVLAEHMGDAYPELRSNREMIQRVILAEEERFDRVLNDGLPHLEAVLALAKVQHRPVAGAEAFRLYDTFGLPLDFIDDLATELGVVVDHAAFERAMEAQREKARAKSAFDGKEEGLSFSEENSEALRAAGDQFDGYTTTIVKGVPVIGLFDEHGHRVTKLGKGEDGYVAIARTPFYVESGGQVSDTGQIFGESGAAVAEVTGMVRGASGWPRLHRARVTRGSLSERDLVTVEVDFESRDATRRNHTATHLLHAALRQVLGGHVKQAGSLVEPARLRFDFVHFAPLSLEQVEEIERLVNEQVRRNAPVQTEVRSTEEAVAAGAMALFGEKYGDRVRVVSVPGFSMELCGGTHCRATGEIGFFTIVSEGGVAAGTRRIEALTGAGGVRHYQERRRALSGILETLNVPTEQAVETIERLQGEVKRLSREVKDLRIKAATGRSDVRGFPAKIEATGTVGPAGADEVEVGSVKVFAKSFEGLGKDELREVADSVRDRLKSGVVVVASAAEGKVSIVVSVTKDLAGRVHAGNVVKQIAPIVGGGGGGRPDFAEAGGKNPDKLDEMLAEGRRVVARMLGA
jgi:alanyl-tRNA synthetase